MSWLKSTSAPTKSKTPRGLVSGPLPPEGRLTSLLRLAGGRSFNPVGYEKHHERLTKALSNFGSSGIIRPYTPYLRDDT